MTDDPHRDPTRTEDVEAELERDPERTLTVLQAMPVDTEFAEKTIRELVERLEEKENNLREWRDAALANKKAARKRLRKLHAARRREERLEERAREVIMWGFDHEHDFPSSDWQETVEHLIDLGERIDRLRSALDSREDEGEGCDHHDTYWASGRLWCSLCGRSIVPDPSNPGRPWEDKRPGPAVHADEPEGDEGRKWFCTRCDKDFWTAGVLGVAMCPYCGEENLALCDDSDEGPDYEAIYEKYGDPPTDKPEGDGSDYGDGFVDGVAWAADQYDGRAPFSWDDAVNASYERSLVCERCRDSTSKERWEGGPVLCRSCRPDEPEGDEPAVASNGEWRCPSCGVWYDAMVLRCETDDCDWTKEEVYEAAGGHPQFRDEPEGESNAGEFCPYCEQYRVHEGRCRGCGTQFGVSYFDDEPPPASTDEPVSREEDRMTDECRCDHMRANHVKVATSNELHCGMKGCDCDDFMPTDARSGEVRRRIQAACDCDPGEEVDALERMIDYYDGMQAWIEHHFGNVVDEIVLEDPYQEPDPKALLASDESVSGEGELPTTVDTGRMRREAGDALSDAPDQNE